MDDVPRPGVLCQLNSDSDNDAMVAVVLRPPLYQVGPTLSTTAKASRSPLPSGVEVLGEITPAFSEIITP